MVLPGFVEEFIALLYDIGSHKLKQEINLHSNPVWAQTAETDFNNNCLAETGSSSAGHSVGLKSEIWCIGPLLASNSLDKKLIGLLLFRWPSFEQNLFGRGGGDGNGVDSAAPFFYEGNKSIIYLQLFQA